MWFISERAQWLVGTKAFLPTQEYVAGCRQRENIGFNDVFSIFGKDPLQSYGPQTSNGQRFMDPF